MATAPAYDRIPLSVGGAGAAPHGCRAHQERARERASRGRAAGGRASNRSAGDRLRGRQQRRYGGAGRGPGHGERPRDRRAAADARSSRRRLGSGGGAGPARGAGSMGLRDGRGPSASARVGRRAPGAGGVARPRRRRGEPLLRPGRRREFRLGARDGLSLDHDGGAAAVPAPAPKRHGSDEWVLPGATRRPRPRSAPPARVQDPARTARPAPRPAGRGGVVHLRRAPVRSKQGGRARSGALPLAAREAALRPVWRCGSFRARREHGRPRLPHGLRRDLLRRVRRLRHPGVDALELLLHRVLGVLGPGRAPWQGLSHGPLLPDEQRGPGAEGAAAHSPDIRTWACTTRCRTSFPWSA